MIWIKVYPAILLIWCITNRRWAVVRATAIAFAAMGVVVIGAAGLDGLTSYRAGISAGFWSTALGLNGAPSRAALWMSVLLGHPLSLDAASTSAQMLLMLAGAALAAVSLRAWAAPVNERTEAASYALALSALLLLSPIVWAHYWVWLLPALVAYLRSLPDPTQWQGKLCLVCCLMTCLPLLFAVDTIGLWAPSGTNGLAAVGVLRAALLLVRVVPVLIVFVLAASLIFEVVRSKYSSPSPVVAAEIPGA